MAKRVSKTVSREEFNTVVRDRERYEAAYRARNDKRYRIRKALFEVDVTVFGMEHPHGGLIETEHGLVMFIDEFLSNTNRRRQEGSLSFRANVWASYIEPEIQKIRQQLFHASFKPSSSSDRSSSNPPSNQQEV